MPGIFFCMVALTQTIPVAMAAGGIGVYWYVHYYWYGDLERKQLAREEAEEAQLDYLYSDIVHDLGRELLFKSAKAGDAAGVRKALIMGADVTIPDKGGYTALHYGIIYDQEHIVRLLLPDKIDDGGEVEREGRREEAKHDSEKVTEGGGGSTRPLLTRVQRAALMQCRNEGFGRTALHLAVMQPDNSSSDSEDGSSCDSKSDVFCHWTRLCPCTTSLVFTNFPKYCSMNTFQKV